MLYPCTLIQHSTKQECLIHAAYIVPGPSCYLKTALALLWFWYTWSIVLKQRDWKTNRFPCHTLFSSLMVWPSLLYSVSMATSPREVTIWIAISFPTSFGTMVIQNTLQVHTDLHLILRLMSEAGREECWIVPNILFPQLLWLLCL